MPQLELTMDHRSAASEFSLGLINSGMDKSGGLVFSNE